jgi:hypothetical protein
LTGGTSGAGGAHALNGAVNKRLTAFSNAYNSRFGDNGKSQSGEEGTSYVNIA